MSDPVKDGLSLLFAALLLGVLLSLIFILPMLAVAAVPFGALVLLWRWIDNSEARQEWKSRKHTLQLYNQVQGQPLPKREVIEVTLKEYLEPCTDEFVAIGTELVLNELASGEIPPPPAICNSIEGGKYRDMLSKMGAQNNQHTGQIIGTVVESLNTLLPSLPHEPSPLSQPASQVLGDQLPQALTEVILPYYKSDEFNSLKKTLNDNLERAPCLPHDYKEDDAVEVFLRNTILYHLFNVQVPFVVPEHFRNVHTHIVGATGSGKTQLIQSMILDDLETPDTIVVIDSQGQLIENISKLSSIPEDRLVIIDPTDIKHPPPISLFSYAGREATDEFEREQAINSAVEMYEYIFSALDAQMTSKQTTAYRYLSRLMFVVPDANIHSLREALEPGEAFREHYHKLTPTVRSFFETEYNSRQFAETRSQILRRLYAIMESSVFEKMFSATEDRVRIDRAIEDGSVILINTAKGLLRETGSSIFGRFWIGQIAQATFQNQSRKKTKLYIDEFHEYASEGYVNVLLEQGRKFGLSVLAAHQSLSQLNPRITAALSTNTDAKYAGGVSASDARALASQMHTDTANILEQRKGTFLAHYRDVGSVPYKVEFGKMENMPSRTSEEMQELKQHMRERYAPPGTIDENSEPIEVPPEDIMYLPPPAKDDDGEETLTKW